MKKIIIIFSALVLGATQMNSQIKEKAESKESGNALKKGDNTVNLYYGTNLLASVYKGLVAQTALGVSVKSIGPFGLMYEHMVTDGIGLGVEGGYKSTSVSYSEEDSYYDYNTGTYRTETYSYSFDVKSIRAMFRANFHFANSEKFDAYFLVSAGYRKTTFTATTNDPSGDVSVNFKDPIPFGVKPGIGLRYFFVPAFGINVEVAAGTPLISGGLTFKF